MRHRFTENFTWCEIKLFWPDWLQFYFKNPHIDRDFHILQNCPYLACLCSNQSKSAIWEIDHFARISRLRPVWVNFDFRAWGRQFGIWTTCALLPPCCDMLRCCAKAIFKVLLAIKAPNYDAEYQTTLVELLSWFMLPYLRSCDATLENCFLSI